MAALDRPRASPAIPWMSSWVIGSFSLRGRACKGHMHHMRVSEVAVYRSPPGETGHGGAVSRDRKRQTAPLNAVMPSESGLTNLDETPSGVMRTVSFGFPKVHGCPVSPVLEPYPARGLDLA